VIGIELEDSRSKGFKVLYQLDLMAAKREGRIWRAPPKRFRRPGAQYLAIHLGRAVRWLGARGVNQSR